MTDEATYDAVPWYNITAKMVVTSTDSVVSNNYYEDEFLISIVDPCRMVTKGTSMTVGDGSTGISTNPYAFDRWSYNTIPIT